jgi:hypothetical protein
MDEIQVRAVGDAIEQRMLPRADDLIPADVRQRRRILEPGRPAGQHAQRGGPVFVAAVEEQLEPEADAEERPVARDPVTDRVDEAVVPEAGHRGRGGPDARNDDRVGVAHGVPVASHGDRRANRGQRLLDAHEVARPVVDDRDPRSANWPVAHPSDPFVEATPSRRGSGSHAVRNARARALKAASARW